MKNFSILEIKKITLVTILINISQILFAQNIGINSTGANPDSSACLDVSSTNKGLLIPRVALSATNLSTPITSPANSLLVYNTATAGTTPNDVIPGYYFWKDSVWIKLVASNTSVEVEDDLRVVIDKGSNSAQLGSLSGITGPEIWFFRDGAGVEAMSFTLQLPHNWKEGSTIHPHIHWVPRATGSGNVKWNLDYSWAELNTTSPVAFPAVTTSTVVATGPFTANTHLLSPLTSGDVGISGTGKSISSILICRIWRDSSLSGDTYTNDAGGLSIDFHITIINQFDQ